MIKVPSSVFIAADPINLALSFDRLAGIVREHLGGDPRGDALFVFHNKRRTHLKLLWHDESGYCVLYKRLDRGVFLVPAAIPAGARRVEISERELRILLAGIDTGVLRAARREALRAI